MKYTVQRLLAFLHPRSDGTRDPEEVEHARRVAFRLVGAVSALGIVASALYYPLTGQTAADPLWSRWVVALLPAGLVLASYVSERVQRHFTVLTYSLFYVLMGWSVVLGALSGFAPNYAVWLLFTFIALSIAHSIGLERPRPLIGFFGFSMLMTAAAFAVAPQPQVDPALFLSCFVLIALVFYAALHLRIRAENNLADSQARSQAVLGQTSDGVYLADAETLRVLEANPAFCRLVGYTSDELRERSVTDLLVGEDGAEMAEAHRLAQAAHRIFECRYRHKEGAAIEVEVSVNRIWYDGADVRCVVVRDIRQRKRTEQMLRQAKKRAEEMLRVKSALLDNISHELRTPLAGILGYASLLQEEVEAPHNEFVAAITANGQRLEDTLNTVLELAHLEGEHAHFDPQPVSVVDVVEEELAAIVPRAEEKGLVLDAQFDAAQERAVVDASALEQILRHLLDNAIKFTESGSVTVRVDAEGPWSIIEVRDTGIGISTQFLSHVFEEFKQESEGLTRSYSGAGLGLTIVDRLVKRMHGHIEVTSEKGEGTAVTVRLPRSEADVSAPVERA